MKQANRIAGGGKKKYGGIHARMFDWGNKYSKKEIK